MQKYRKEKLLTLLPLKNKKIRYKKILGFDIETANNNKDMVLAVITDGVQSWTFTNRDNLYAFVKNTRFLRDCLILATNLAFDFFGSFYDYEHCSQNRNNHFYQGKIYQANGIRTTKDGNKIKRKNHVVTFYDTGNFLKASVEQLGKMVGVEKLPPPKALGKVPQNEEEFKELNVYCENDANISRLFFEKYIQSFCVENNIPIKSTIASIALAYFRRKHQAEKYFVKNHKIEHPIIFKAYYGGRTEVFKRGQFGKGIDDKGNDKHYSKPIHVFDANSLYPSQMLKELPHPNFARVVNCSNIRLIEKYHGVSYIEGYIKEQYVSPLPHRRDDGRLLFSTGKISGYYTHIEIRNALENGLTLTDIKNGVYYTRTCKPFVSYVNDLYKLRLQYKKENNPFQLTCKLLMNGLYGKWGLNYRKSKTLKSKYEITLNDIKNASKVEMLKDGYYFALTVESDKPPTYSFPIWSVYITAYARIKMFKELVRHREQLLYCDTDSLFLMGDSPYIKNSDELGEFKLEYIKDHGFIIRSKFYQSEKVKIKGVNRIKQPDGSFKRITEEDFYSLLQNPKVTMQRFVKLPSALRSKMQHKNGELHINQVIEVNKVLSLDDNKRQWDKEKFSPFEIQNSKPHHIK